MHKEVRVFVSSEFKNSLEKQSLDLLVSGSVRVFVCEAGLRRSLI
jgi:hypothetical protein